VLYRYQKPAPNATKILWRIVWFSDWVQGLAGLHAKLTAEAAARVTLQSAAAVWDADWGQVFDITRSASVLARERFQTEPTQYGRFANQAPSKRSFWRSMGSRRLASCSSFVLVLVLETSEHTIEHEDEGRAPRRLAVATGA